MRIFRTFMVLAVAASTSVWTPARADIVSGLVAYYPFLGDAHNVAGPGNHGVVHGAALVADRYGTPNAAYHFDGVNDWIEASATGFPTAERTVSAWFNAEDVSTHPCVLGYAGSPQAGGHTWFMCINHGNQQSFHMSCHYEENAINYYYPEPPEGAWYHFVVTTSSSGTYLFVNGVLRTSNTLYVDDTPSTGTDLAIGVIVDTLGQGPYIDGNVHYFNGELDDIRIYDRALSADDVMELYLNDGSSCGDSTVDDGEDCDDGNHVNEDGCDSNCTFPGCGNGVETSGEQCDDGNVSDGDGCESDCTPSCGNSTVDVAAGEQCDDGNGVDDDGCDGNCTAGGCGNGIVNASTGETCDDGDLTNGDGCDGNCSTTGCGNGIVTGTEECDDGNAASGDGCENDCLRSCGNGTVDGLPTEACDDGNRTSGDGCDANCTATACGNGIITAGEQCDVGVPQGTVSCDAKCQLLCLATDSALLAWWPGDVDAREVVAGRSGTELAGVTHAPGVVSSAFSFDGSGIVEVPDDPVWTLGSNDFTINLWVRFSTLSSRSPFIGHDENGGEFNKWIFWYDAQGHRAPSGPALRLHVNSPTIGPIDPVVALWTPALDHWYHVAVTRETDSFALYIDGAQVTTETDSHEIPDPLVPLTIGKAEGYLFNGLLDEVQIHSRALSASEIAAIFAAGIAGHCSPCGNGTLDPTEQCDDANDVASDGCDPGCVFTPEAISGTTPPGEQLTTDTESDGATPTDPIETFVQVPAGGVVSISENVADTQRSFGIFRHSIAVSAPAATTESPLVLGFRIDASQLPPGFALPSLSIVKDGADVEDCTGLFHTATPDPCITSSSFAADGDLEIVVLTSSASTWTFAECGNGVREIGEECDQGIGDDGCSECRVAISRLIPGRGQDADCEMEWIAPAPGVEAEKALTIRRFECIDGNPACDFGDEQDVCTFRLASCFQIDDPRLGCSPSELSSVELLTPRMGSEDPTDVTNRSNLEHSLSSFGGSVRGICENSGATTVECAVNAACNSDPDSRDGRCRRYVELPASFSSQPQCTDPIFVRVPLKRSGAGRGVRKLRLLAGYPEPDGAGDTDKIRLVCRDH